MSKPDSSLHPVRPTAIVVSGGKQYRVGVGDRILVDRLAAESGSSVKLGRVLMFSDGGEVKVGKDAADLDVDATVIGHPRGPRLESLRYKSKKRVRVHRGGRAHLTALEIIAIGGIGVAKPEVEEKKAEKPKRGSAKAAPKKKVAAKAEVVAEEEAPKKTTTRRRTTKKESE